MVWCPSTGPAPLTAAFDGVGSSGESRVADAPRGKHRYQRLSLVWSCGVTDITCAWNIHNATFSLAIWVSHPQAPFHHLAEAISVPIYDGDLGEPGDVGDLAGGVRNHLGLDQA